MPTIEYKGKSYEVDEDGFLSNPENWDEDFAQAVADQVCLMDEESLEDLYFFLKHKTQDLARRQKQKAKEAQTALNVLRKKAE